MKVLERVKGNVLVVNIEILVYGATIDGGNRRAERVILLECFMVNLIYYQHVDVRTLIIRNKKSTKRDILRLLVLIQENYLTMVVGMVVEKDVPTRYIDEK